MSISPGSRIESPEVDDLAFGFAADADDPVASMRRMPGETISPASTSSSPAALRVSTG